MIPVKLHCHLWSYFGALISNSKSIIVMPHNSYIGSQPNTSMSNLASDIDGSVPPKPKRPLTAFNLFSILERSYILQQSQETHSEGPSNDIANDPYAATRPERYRNVVLPSEWFVVGMNNTTEVKRNNHGVISFLNLSKAISDRWNSVDTETKLYCEMIAADEFKRYRENLAAYEEMYGKDLIKARKRMHKNLSKNNDKAAERRLLRENKGDAGEESDGSSQRTCARAYRAGSVENASGDNIEVNVSSLPSIICLILFFEGNESSPVSKRPLCQSYLRLSSNLQMHLFNPQHTRC
ncbi:hypothetical protein ACHAW6_008639 [Cyclotella cf. meneghiniana]